MNWINGINTASLVAAYMTGITAMLTGAVALGLTVTGDIDTKLRNTTLAITAVSATLALVATFIHGATL